MTKFRNLSLLFLMTLIFPLLGAHADLRAPIWWDPDGVGVGQDWHYRIPVTLPATSSTNSTATVDIAFGLELLNMGINPGVSTFDVNSVRVVRPDGALATIQQFTDRRFANASDAPNNAAGEVRWIVEGNGAQTYYIYFDIAANGPKSPNPQLPINGNFEFASVGQEDPIGWSGTRLSGYDAEIRPIESVTVTDDGPGGSNLTSNTAGGPNTGQFSYLLGRRSNPETQVSIEAGAGIRRTFSVPLINPGVITVRYRVEGWGSAQNNNGSVGDYFQANVTNGVVSRIVVGPQANNYITTPFSPNLGLNAVSPLNSGFGQYNGFDTTTTGVHTAGGTIAQGAQPWITASVPLDVFAGQTISLEVGMFNSNGHRSWAHVDDIEWSVVNATAGTAEGFGVQILSPAPSLFFTTNQPFAVSAQVDARPTAASQPVIAEIYVSDTTLLGSFPLFNDGAHGDGAANDNIWANDGTDAANPPFAIPDGQSADMEGRIRVTARDGSVSTLGAPNNGRIHRNGLPNLVDEVNYWNVDQVDFDFAPANLNVVKTSTVIDDPVNTSNAKAIPGSTVQYCLTITNTGPDAENIQASDILPPEVTFVAGSIFSGDSCATATTAEDDDDIDGDFGDLADGVGASFDRNTNSVFVVRSVLANSQSFAVIFDVKVN